MFGLFKSKKEKAQDTIPEEMRIVMVRAFPDGDKQIDLETSRLHLALNGKLSASDTKSLLVWTKVMLVIGEDKSLEFISDGILRHEGGRLSKNEAELVYRCVTGISGKIFTGGDGYSLEDSVVINCSITAVGQYLERKWLLESFGTEDIHWQLKTRLHGYNANGRAFETFVLQFPQGEDVSIHFDISQWYLKS